jgi:hypothetical protein
MRAAPSSRKGLDPELDISLASCRIGALADGTRMEVFLARQPRAAIACAVGTTGFRPSGARTHRPGTDHWLDTKMPPQEKRATDGC